MNMNETMINTNLPSDYDHNGAIIYTIITLLFYSLSLFCSLILNIDPEDQYYENKWAIYQNGTKTKTVRSSQSDILNTLSDQSIRMRYWRIYYGDAGLQSLSHKFVSDELKRVSNLSKRMKELNYEHIKRSSKHREIDEFNRIGTNNSQMQSRSPSNSSFLLKFRRARSTSVPGVFQSDYSVSQRSLNPLSQTPLCKPSPAITLTEYS